MILWDLLILRSAYSCRYKKSHAQSPVHGTKSAFRGTTHFPHPPCHGRDSPMRLTCACVQSYHPPIPTDFTPAAPVGNSCHHLNAGKLAAGDLPSLCENDALLYTFIAFKIITVIILEVFLVNVKIFFLTMRHISILHAFLFCKYAF